MAFSGVRNLANSTVATAPDPADSGTSLVVATGEGALFPDPETEGTWYATVYPDGETPTKTNAEIVLVTALSTDTATIMRAQGSTSARIIVVGDQIMLGWTAEMVDARDALTAAALWTMGVR